MWVYSESDSRNYSRLKSTILTGLFLAYVVHWMTEQNPGAVKGAAEVLQWQGTSGGGFF